jgi:hypothetical protein
LGFGAAGALADEADAGLTEPGGGAAVVEVGPVTAVEVSDVLTFDAVRLVESVLLVLAAEAVLVALPLQARAAKAIETRTERYIFPSCFQR